MKITIKLTDNDKFLTDYIQENNIDTSNLTVSDFFELVEDAHDLHELRLAQAEDDGTRYTLEEVLEHLGVTQEDLDSVD